MQPHFFCLSPESSKLFPVLNSKHEKRKKTKHLAVGCPPLSRGMSHKLVCSNSGVPRTSRFHLALVRVTREVIIREGSRTVGVIYQDWWLVFFFFMKERRSADFCANHAVPPFVPRISQQVCYFTNDCHHVLISTLMTSKQSSPGLPETEAQLFLRRTFTELS